MIGGFVVLAALVSGFLMVNHYVWSSDDANGDSNYLLETVAFRASLPSAPVVRRVDQQMLGSMTSVPTWSIGTDTQGISVMTVDADLAAPDAAADPAAAAQVLKGGHDAFVAAVLARVGGASGTVVAARVNGDPGWRSEVSVGRSTVFLTTLMHGSVLVAVECGTVARDVPADCSAVLNSLRFR